ncbi:unnamed protein product, partial [Discosporangium mesarthrocarpum]
MPRRMSTRHRVSGSTGAAGVVAPAPSPGKRKTRSPADEMQSCSAPSAIRCAFFQSPKKKSMSGGEFGFTGDKENGPVLDGGAGGVGTVRVGARGSVSFQPSVFSAFSRTPNERREADVGEPLRGEGVGKGSPVPFLMPTGNFTTSPSAKLLRSCGQRRGLPSAGRSIASAGSARSTSGCSVSSASLSPRPPVPWKGDGEELGTFGGGLRLAADDLEEEDPTSCHRTPRRIPRRSSCPSPPTSASRGLECLSGFRLGPNGTGCAKGGGPGGGSGSGGNRMVGVQDD